MRKRMLIIFKLYFFTVAEAVFHRPAIIQANSTYSVKDKKYHKTKTL